MKNALIKGQGGSYLTESPLKYILIFYNIFLFSSSSQIYLYAKNSAILNIEDLYSSLIIFFILGIFIFIIFFIILKDVYKSIFITFINLIFIQNYVIIEKIVRLNLPFIRYWHFIPICLTFILIVSLLIKNKNKEFFIILVNFLLILFSLILIFNLFIIIPNEAKKHLIELNQNSKTENKIIYNKTPNIYWLLFDEYASFNQIQKYYNYDNPLKDFLLNKKFIISENSYNESWYTSTVITNYINLSYVVTDKTEDIIKSKYRTSNANLFTKLKIHGYSIDGIGETINWGIKPVEGKIKATVMDEDGNNFYSLFMKKTIFYPLIREDQFERAKFINNTFNYLNYIDYSDDKNKFIFTYLCTPHLPFLFDEYGNNIDYALSNNWKDKQIYLGQYKYITKQIISVVDHILETDPNCIIVLQSDHGARGNEEIIIDEKDKREILNCVYYKGYTNIDLEGLSGVNTLRVILNNVLELNYEILEVPK